jgi:hypothetical protein
MPRRPKGYEQLVIFRSADRRRPSPLRERRDAVLAAAERTFGRLPDAADDRLAAYHKVVFVYDEAYQPPFVLRPTCDRCGRHDLDQFPLERRSILGVDVHAQAMTTCRDCRFLQVTAAD